MNTLKSLSGLVTACLALGLSVGAQANAPAPSLEALMEMAGDTEASFLEVIETQREAGIAPSLILPIEAIYAIRFGDYSRSDLVIKELAMVAEDGSFLEDGFFTSKEEVLSIKAIFEAQRALEGEDMESFEMYVKEAFWLDPEMGSIIAEVINAVRQEERMSSLRFPMEQTIQHSDGSSTTLAELVEGKKAVLLDFWATWCGPCIRLMPELVKKWETLEPQGVVVAGMNTEGIEEAESFRKQEELNMTWLVEPAGRPLSNLLAVDSIPRMILVSPEGEILFNGHPMEDSLETALAGLGVTL